MLMGMIVLYLHIGLDIEIPVKNIIFMLDAELANAKFNKGFFNRVDEIISISSKKPKTLILVENTGLSGSEKKYTLFTSPISTHTLKKRLRLRGSYTPAI